MKRIAFFIAVAAVCGCSKAPTDSSSAGGEEAQPSPKDVAHEEDNPGRSVVLDTPTWSVTFPPGWSRGATPSGKSEQMSGPSDDFVTIQTCVIRGEGTEEELTGLVAELERMGHMMIGELQQGLAVIEQPGKRELPAGGFMVVTLAHGVDRFVANSFAINGRVMLFVTHEGPRSAEGGISSIRAALRNIKWTLPSE